MWTKINHTTYNGNLNNYSYPTNKEFGGLLVFLKQIATNKQIYLIDRLGWNPKYPPTDYDIYIICAFGESFNTDILHRLENDPAFADKQIVLLTSQFYQGPEFKRTKIFYIEHLHALIPFLQKPEYTKLQTRKFTHGSLSNRNAMHKALVTAKLLGKFGNKLQYTFCNTPSSEYDQTTFTSGWQKLISEFELTITDSEIELLNYIHVNPIKAPGHTWTLDNRVLKDSKLLWTCESMFVSCDDQPVAYLTEKIMKSIVTGCCFVLVSQERSTERLKLLGFESFESEFKLDYDSDVDSIRYKKIFEFIDTFDQDKLLDSPAIQELVDYNHNHFYHTFYDHVTKTNVDKIQQAIEYINAI